MGNRVTIRYADAMASSSTGGVLASLLDGTLRPETTIISDSLVQPGLSLFREILLQSLKRDDERVCVLLTENDPRRVLGEDVLAKAKERGRGRAASKPTTTGTGQHGFKIIDCFNEHAGGSSTSSTSQTQEPLVQHIDIEDVAALSSSVQDSQPTLLLVDSLNALETFSGSTASYRFLKSFLSAGGRDQSRSIIALHHSDLPTSPVPSTSTSLPLLSSLLSPSFTSALLHIRLHTPSVLTHLYYAYGIEQVGQDGSAAATAAVADDVDTRVYDYLPLLHGRNWASPLQTSEYSAADGAGATAIEDLDVGAYDSPNPRDVRLALLDLKPTGSSGNAGRTVAEYSMRGIAKNRRRSEATKIARGLEGIRAVWDEKTRTSSVAATGRVADVLRIKIRRLQVEKKATDTNKTTDPTAAAALFNLSLTDRQREARESVDLQYTPKDTGEIIYQPDSADDMDESDPDEDLDL